LKTHARAPATTANLGPAFDCAGAALDLWNEVVVEDDPDAPEPDLSHLGVRAFSLVAPPAGRRFAWTDRIPRERGLGSSSSVIVLGLVAATLSAGEPLDAERLLALGLQLEPHPDNLAPCLVGGVCLSWDCRIARIADTTPGVPIALIPSERTNTLESRARLPARVSHRDAAHTAGRAAMLGAALASSDPSLFAAALDDRLHEPYRSSFLVEVRGNLPDGALGATLSGSGPTVLVWAERGREHTCARELRRRYATVEVVVLDVTAAAAGQVR
jgi:homoserine kinase